MNERKEETKEKKMIEKKNDIKIYFYIIILLIRILRNSKFKNIYLF